MLEKAIKTLKKAGFDIRKTTIRVDENTTAPAIFVIHNYDGLYPDTSALTVHANAAKIACKYGLHYEKRGYCTATLIY